jgi:hypothetical protein
MKKHEMLEKAMRDYPKGTKVKSLHGTEFITSGIFYIDGSGWVADNFGFNVYNPLKDKWAEIIEEETRIQLDNPNQYAIIEKEYIDICVSNLVIRVTPFDVEQIYNTYKQLNK